MTETGGTVERLKRGVAFLAATDGPALLAVVEAAQEAYRLGRPLPRNLCIALAALHSQASDDSEDRVLGPKEHYDLEAQEWVPGQASDEGKA